MKPVQTKIAINKENLQIMYDHISGIEESRLHMGTIRNKSNIISHIKSNHVCKSVGCILGHCIELDSWENIPYEIWDGDATIDFSEWSYKFLNLPNTFHTKDIWSFLFSGMWANNRITNSKEQILKRMKYVIDNGNVPEEFQIKLNFSQCILP